MAENGGIEATHAGEESSLMEKIGEKLHLNKEEAEEAESRSSSSDSEPEKKVLDASSVSRTAPSDVKDKIYRLFGRQKPLHQVLGGGKPADLFLWRNKKISAGVLGTGTAIWVLFEVLEYRLLPLVSHILIFALGVLFLWASATTFITKSPPRISEVSLPEQPFLELASAFRQEFNRGFTLLREIALGKDLKKFLGVIAGLWFLATVGKCFDFLTLFYINFVLLHTLPVLYEKYDDKIDSYAEKAMAEANKYYGLVNEKYLSKIPRGPLKNKKAD